MSRNQRLVRDLFSVALALIAMMFFAYRESVSRKPLKPRSETGSGFHVKDGDSMDHGKTVIRLHGIDAPEYQQSCEDADGVAYPCGKRAADALRGLIRGKTASCERVERDRYARDVSTCRVGPLIINAEMVRLGWAIAYRKHSELYVAAEREARTAKRGIWAGRFEAPEAWRKRHARSHGDINPD